MAEVFISYCQSDRELVAPIAAALAELGVDAWFDREILAGESFGAVIRARLSEAKAVLVCWTPEATKSEWVDSEADYARQRGSYVPVFLVHCALMPPFNRLHADDLSTWGGARTNPNWLKVVERVAELIGRQGVSAAASALASTDEERRYQFAQTYPDEPVAKKIWRDAEARHREAFNRRMSEARNGAVAQINAERAAVDARLAAMTPAFETWLADERRGVAKVPRPDPVALVHQQDLLDETGLRSEIAALSNALAVAKAGEADLTRAKEEVARLSERLEAESVDGRRLRDEITALHNAQEQTKAENDDLEATRKQIVRLSGELASLKAKGSAAHAQQLPILDILLAVSASIMIYFGVIFVFGTTNYIHPVITIIAMIIILVTGYGMNLLTNIRDSGGALVVFKKYSFYFTLCLMYLTLSQLISSFNYVMFQLNHNFFYLFWLDIAGPVSLISLLLVISLGALFIRRGVTTKQRNDYGVPERQDR
jgi:hypothetical protein